LTPGSVTAKVLLKTLSPELKADNSGLPFQISENGKKQLFLGSVFINEINCPEEMTIDIELSIRPSIND
jgi:hypothetical protein